ncbi:MAG: hypothetical protein E7B07_02625 [Enterobacter asburiae]|uniref:hypothetical protein n=1 Tax=Enterobacter asburiae TaxID=61645 RepID=UPI001F30EDF1|nr:hypothetical protein [Enterobacter asburiae]MDU0845398.1 hypothetical protein [Enterobacter asburiae]MDU0854165.1 hypothetical protein [Enterobacter asburiae]
MSNIDKQALVIPQREKHDWSQAVMRDCDFCQQWALTVWHSDGGCICASCCDSEYTTALSSALVVAIERSEAAEKRIAELQASHNYLREAMAGIHNTITGGGAYTPLAAILNASKRAYEESAAAAGKGE